MALILPPTKLDRAKDLIQTTWLLKALVCLLTDEREEDELHLVKNIRAQMEGRATAVLMDALEGFSDMNPEEREWVVATLYDKAEAGAFNLDTLDVGRSPT